MTIIGKPLTVESFEEAIDGIVGLSREEVDKIVRAIKQGESDKIDNEALKRYQKGLKMTKKNDRESSPEEKAKFLAEARMADAQAAYWTGKAEQQRHETEYSRITTDEKLRKEKLDLAADYYARIYHFTDEVSEGSVAMAISIMSRWSRLSPGCDMTLIICSPGGSLVAGMAFYDFLLDLRRKGHKVTTISRGYAASMGGILLQAGTERVAGKESWILIHQAAFGTIGKLGEVEDRVEWIKAICERILDIFADRASKATGKDRASVRNFIKKNWERKDFWVSSDDALKHGLIDRIEEMPDETSKQKAK